MAIITFAQALRACQDNNFGVVAQWLDETGSHSPEAINDTDAGGCTPFYFACANGDIHIVDLLLQQKNIDINKANNAGITPLNRACQDKPEIVRLLLQQPNIDINKPAADGLTPLNRACMNKQSDITQLLLEKDIDVNAPDNKGKSPLYFASQSNDIATVKLLLKKPELAVNQSNETGLTPLMKACAEGNEEIVQLLLTDPRTDIDQTDNLGLTAIQWANKTSNKSIVQLLFKSANKAISQIDNQNDNQDSTSNPYIFRAAVLSRIESSSYSDTEQLEIRDIIFNNKHAELKHDLAISFLSNKKININLLDRNKSSLLIKACETNSYIIIDRLLKFPNLDINHKDDKGHSALYWAINNDSFLTVAQLLQFPNIDMNQQDPEGHTPLYWALEKNNPIVINLLIKHPNIILPVLESIKYPNRKVYKELNNFMLVYTIEQILEKIKLPPNLDNLRNMQFNHDLRLHAHHVYKHFYSRPWYSLQSRGIKHTSRVALYIPVFLNFYRRYENADAMQVSGYDLKLLQIAALYHETAQGNGGKNFVDHESASILYYYLTKTLGVNPEKAHDIAEAVANKDYNSYKGLELEPTGKAPLPKNQDIYYKLHITADKKITWEKITSPQKKSIFSKVLQCANSMDVGRFLPGFHDSYLDIYQDYHTSIKKREKLINEIAELRLEVTSLLAKTGDEQGNLKTGLDDFDYDSGECFELISADLKQYPILSALNANNNILPVDDCIKLEIVKNEPYHYDPTQPLTAAIAKHLARDNKLFSRGTSLPSFSAKQNLQESYAGTEIRLALSKKGNKFRSISLLNGNRLFCDAGFLIPDIVRKKIHGVSIEDIGSGHEGKKSYKQLANDKNLEPEFYELYQFNRLPLEQQEQKLESFFNLIKRGGISTHFKAKNYDASHNEIIYDISRNDFKAIFFTHDHNLKRVGLLDQPESQHRHSPVLQAIFIQNEYKNLSGGVKLPIIEYSAVHNAFYDAPDFTDEDIITMWQEACSAYIQSEHNQEKLAEILLASTKDIKINSLFGEKTDFNYCIRGSADENYPPKLKDAINSIVKNEKLEALKNALNNSDIEELLLSNMDSLDNELKQVIQEKLAEKLAGNSHPQVNPFLPGNNQFSARFGNN
jgi:ankyrin repeat protein